ncbi:TPA: hypothetical protein ACUEMK_004656 [Escherichia coli]
MIPSIVSDINNLLNQLPVTKRFSALSERYSYLVKPAAELVKRLIIVKHPQVFEHASLDILHKLSVREDAYNEAPLKQLKMDLAELIQNWPELKFLFGLRQKKQELFLTGH